MNKLTTDLYITLMMRADWVAGSKHYLRHYKKGWSGLDRLLVKDER